MTGGVDCSNPSSPSCGAEWPASLSRRCFRYRLAMVAPDPAVRPEASGQREYSLRCVSKAEMAQRDMPNDLPPWAAVCQPAQRLLAIAGVETWPGMAGCIVGCGGVYRSARGHRGQPQRVARRKATLAGRAVHRLPRFANWWWMGQVRAAPPLVAWPSPAVCSEQAVPRRRGQ
jgi:hypothetical protein